MTFPKTLLALGAWTGSLIGCSSPEPLATVAQVDLQRFMGDWFVLAHIPAGAEKNAYNAVESYELEEDGTIATTYIFREGGFDGELETLQPNGRVRDQETNAEWGMQFIWPFRSEFLITHLSEDYQTTIIGRTKRDYAWIMARTPELPVGELDALVALLEDQGYDVSEVRLVPHRWPDPGHPRSP